MRTRDNLKLRTNLLIEVREASSGALLRVIRRHNLVTLAGRNLIRDLLGNISSARLTHFAVGTNGTAPAAGNTTLGAEVYRDAVTKTTFSSGKLSIQYYLPSTAANGSTLQECGIFTASSSGTLFARAIYAGIAKTASISVTFTWDVSFAAS